MVDSKIKNLVEDYLNQLTLNGIFISKAYIFGSRVDGSANEESDIDVMLISPMFDQDADKFAGTLWITAGNIDYKIEPYPIGEKRFYSEDFSPLIEIVKHHGVEVIWN